MDKSKKPSARPRGQRGQKDTQVDQMPTTTRAPGASVSAVPSDGSAHTDVRTENYTNVHMDGAIDASAIDPRDPRTQAQLQRRTPSGGYEIPEAALVRAIRTWGQSGATLQVRALLEVLIDRCMPEFKRRAWGLRHRPELMEEAIAGMIEQVLREAQDQHETFMTQNFIHYLRCCCADNFGRVLRQEGLSYRRDEQGRPAGRPLHVPQALVERIDLAAEDREESTGQAIVVADPHDTLEDRMAALEAQRILAYLADPLDRQIMVLRALDHMRWDDIAKICGKTERTMRLRYEKAVVRLRQCIEAEAAAVAH